MVGIKIALLLLTSAFINVKKGMSELGCRVAAKHTTDKQHVRKVSKSVFPTAYMNETYENKELTIFFAW